MKVTMTKPSWHVDLTFGKVYDVKHRNENYARIIDDAGFEIGILIYTEECAFMNGDGGMWIVVDGFEDQGEENA